MKKKRNKSNNSMWSRFVNYIKKNYVNAIIFIIGIVVTLLITKACDKIIPDSPLVVERIPDTIQIVHYYESLSDTNRNAITDISENIIKTAVVKPQKTDKDFFDGRMANKVMRSVSFPNAKGYTIQSAAPYFSLEMNNLDQSFVDFIFHFFNDDILSDIYCLFIQVSINQNGKKICILDEYYEKRKNDNIIRLNNFFTSGSYEIEVGFILSRDKETQYPNFYREVKYINN